MHYAYSYDVQAEPEGGFFISFPDVPEALTRAERDAEVPGMAQNALVTALSFYTDDGRALPVPSCGGRLAQVPVVTALKLALHDAMLASGMSNVALAKQLGLDEKAVRRLRDPMQGSRVEGLEAALRALGPTAEIHVMDVVE